MISILFEDEDILVIDKPAGMIVNKSDTTKEEYTVQEWAEDKFKIPALPARFARLWRGFDARRAGRQSSKFKVNEETDFYNRGGIVHRLDKETSGILIIAKNPASFENLQKQFKERIVKKTYLALVHGKVEPEEGEIRVPVGRLPWNRKRFGVVAGGREAATRYRVISNFQFPISNELLSLVELYPETGRTHQIRVHLKYINHPIFADFLYAGRKTARNDRRLLSRVFLHASKISFHHPTTGENLAFESPLPEELIRALTMVST